MKVSVIIPTFGRPDLVRLAAASAATQHLPASWQREILVIDDGGKDATRQALKGLKGVRYFWKQHAGPAAARNWGAARAKGSILAFLDSDTVAQAGWLEAGLKHLLRQPKLFAVEGKVLPDRLATPTPLTEAVTNLAGGRWLTCNLFVRAAEFKKLKGFDERFRQPVREDSEFAFRAQEAGWEFAFEPKARVVHPVRQVSPKRYFYHAREGQYEALIERQHPILYRRHFKWLDGRAVPVYYWAHYAALPLAAFNVPVAFAALLAGSAAVLYAWCRKRRVGMDVLKLLPLALLVPYLRLFWVAKGYWLYPKSPQAMRG